MYVNPHQHGERKYQTKVPPTREHEHRSRAPRACFLLASTGLEPQGVHEPWEYLTSHGFFIEFATWDGQPAAADSTLLSHTLWGSKYSLQTKWKEFVTLDEWLKPHAWAPVTRAIDAVEPAVDDTTNSGSKTRPAETLRALSSDTPVQRTFDLDNYDLVLIPGGWATREHLEKDIRLHEILSKYCLNLPRSLGSKVLAVIGDGISPLLSVKHPLTGEPLLKGLESTGPGFDSWSGIVTGKDLGSLIPKLVKKYRSRQLTIDPDNWYLSSPSSAFNKDLCPALSSLVKSAVRVSELRNLERQNKRLSTVQTQHLEAALEYDGLTSKQKERLHSDGIGKADSGFVFTNWSWGWRNDYA